MRYSASRMSAEVVNNVGFPMASGTYFSPGRANGGPPNDYTPLRARETQFRAYCDSATVSLTCFQAKSRGLPG